jgi:L-alanine-DL-glutamate epimerase-like enolase superfamily enzyme
MGLLFPAHEYWVDRRLLGSCPETGLRVIPSVASLKSNAPVSVPDVPVMTASKWAKRSSILPLSNAFKRVPARNPIAFAARRSNGPWRTRLIVSSKSSLTSPTPLSATTVAQAPEDQGVELIEQPMPAHMFEEVKYVRSKVHMPIIADEACTSTGLIPKLKEAYDGINVKLDKAGGILEAYRWIKMARALDMKVMLGCMISSSCSCTAAAHLSPLVDYPDLDGNLLISNDPFEGVKVADGKLILPSRPGLGLKVLG